MSPLENHHLSEAFKILRKRDYDFLRRMSKEKQVRLRNVTYITQNHAHGVEKISRFLELENEPGRACQVNIVDHNRAASAILVVPHELAVWSAIGNR